MDTEVFLTNYPVQLFNKYFFGKQIKHNKFVLLTARKSKNEKCRYKQIETMGRRNYWHVGELLIFIYLLRIMQMVFTLDILAEQPDDYWLIDNTSSSAKIHSNRESSTIEKHMIKIEEIQSMVQKLSTELELTQSHLQRMQKDKNSTLANVQKLQMKMVETEKKLGQADVENVKLQRDKHDLEDQIKQKAFKFNYDPAKSENVVQYFGPLWPETFWPTKKPGKCLEV